MSEKRTIQINPDLFKISDKNTTRKKRESTPKIKLKSTPKEKKQNQKSIRRNIIKMIREKQQDEYRKLFDDKSKSSSPGPVPKSLSNDEFSKDFEDSYKFLSELVDKENDETNQDLSKTFKKYPVINPTESLMLQPSMKINTNENVAIDIPQELKEPVYNIPFNYKPQTPKYGCLKNGSLPTYRNWKNQTQKIYPKIDNQTPIPINTPISIQPVNTPLPTFQNPLLITNNMQNNAIKEEPVLEVSPIQLKPPAQKSSWEQVLDVQDKIKNMRKKLASEKKQMVSKMQNPNKKQVKYKKQKKIYRRTYKVGKSKIMPKVGVLVSNHTIRSRIKNQTHDLSKVPIKDVRRFLIKKGFIKVGTIAPPDVLRKMYESVCTVCGEVKNHNSENLLYNFLNDNEQIK
tara:strand:- start:4769 stop:5971 length:1203 start_codon:yes stop_codon:yes gene_type:complete